MSRPNYYDILGVSENADENEIKRAYMKLSLKHHPDRNEDKEEATRKFQEISSAYETLKDSQLRQKYDHELKYGSEEGGGGGFPGDDMNDINNIFNMMFGQGFPGQGFPGRGQGFPGQGFPGAYPGMGFPGMGAPNIRVFNMGGGMDPHMIFQQIHKPPPLVKQIEISLEHVYHGGSYTFDLERTIVKNGMQIAEIEPITVDIPQGIGENECMVMPNHGNMYNENSAGDLKIQITISRHDIFKRVGNDLIYQKKLSLKESLCGFLLEVNHLNGKLINMNNTTNPTIIKPGYKKVVPNMGMIRNLQTGNLVIEFEVVFPDKLTESQIESLKELL
jgi:DnaJ-class molecular chaperone